MQPILAITMGDPAGVGAEICVKTLSRPQVFINARPFVMGNLACLRQAMTQTGIQMPLRQMAAIDDLQPHAGAIQVLEVVRYIQGMLK